MLALGISQSVSDIEINDRCQCYFRVCWFWIRLGDDNYNKRFFNSTADEMSTSPIQLTLLICITIKSSMHARQFRAFL